MSDLEFTCHACRFEWRGERERCPSCRADAPQPALFGGVERAVREATTDEVAAINSATADETAEWVGLPEFLPVSDALKVVVSCDSVEDRDRLLRKLGIDVIHKGTRGTLSVWWPNRDKEDLSSLRFEASEGARAASSPPIREEESLHRHQAPPPIFTPPELPDDAPDWERSYWAARGIR